MKLYCNCLNICIEIFGDLISDTPINAVHPVDLMDEESCEVEVIQISHRLPHLIKEKINDQWKIYSCLNCRLFVYATRKELNNSIVINKKLLNDPNIVSELSLSENFSPAFKIILKQDDSISEDMCEQRLHEVAATWLREEAQRTEERIRNYTEQQYAALENHRLRAHKDDFIINRIVTQANISDRMGDNKNDSKDQIGSTPKKNAKNKSIIEEIVHDGSDAIMFPLDDFDHPAKDYSDGPSDEDEEDLSKIVQMRKSSTSAHLARSLPIPVPQYMHDLAYEEKSNGSPPVPTDIAASIKALAKSVHGDSVFGELPRPRFRNHL